MPPKMSGENQQFVGMRVRLSVQSEDVLRRIMKKHSLDNFSDAIEHLCVQYEMKDK